MQVAVTKYERFKKWYGALLNGYYTQGVWTYKILYMYDLWIDKEQSGAMYYGAY